ncbi:Ig-like domain-containing protein [Ohtaekwangia koreensis]|nr:RHS repeat protein [Ohtaekwangia koreensis]
MICIPALAQPSNNCVINGPSTACTDQQVYFNVACDSYDGTFYWFVDGVQAAVGTTVLDYSFPTAKTYQVTYQILLGDDGHGGLVWGDAGSSSIVITSAPTAPVIQSSALSICASGSVTLTVTNASSGNYTWSSIPAGYSATGTSATFNNVTSSTQFVVQRAASGCAVQSSINVSVLSTIVLPVAESATPYHKKVIKGNTQASDHYWQVSASGTSMDRNLMGTRTVTEAGTFWVRRYNSQGSCWTTATGPLAITVSYIPPVAEVRSAKQIGYSDLYFVNNDRDHILQFADYYFVTSGASNASVVKSFIEEGQVVNQRIYSPGIYYIRGKDRVTGTWGEAVSVDVQFADDAGINSIYTKSFDGMSNIPFAESKRFFDNNGNPLQTQTLVHNLDGNRVFSSGEFRDKYDRVVGSTLAAPILSNAFSYSPELVIRENAEGSYTIPSDRIGTVGWYYSAANSLENHVPISNFPYTQVEYYNDGTGEVKSSSGLGEALRRGSGREILSGTFPIYGELNDYLSKRSTAITGIVHDGALKNEGLQTVARDQNGKYTITIADKEGNNVMSARAGVNEPGGYALAISNSVVSSADPLSSNYRRMTYFYILHDQPVSITGSIDFVIENIVTNERKDIGQTFAGSNGVWPAGFYRVLLNNNNSEVTLSYTNYFTDVSYQFYNDAGRLISSVSPNGFVSWKSGTAYSTIDKTTYKYNHRGWLLELREPDAGRTRYVYRKDGNIRFSQNAEQRKSNRFSYTHYDPFGRPVESGEYTGTEVKFIPMDSSVFVSSEMNNVLEETSADENWTQDSRKDWVETFYDFKDTEVFNTLNLPSEFDQTFVRSAVSTSKNVNIQTWYGYDEFGRVVWIAQKPKTLPRLFIVRYTHDFLGNILTVANVTYDLHGNRLQQFYHHYEYDAEKRLSKAYTSLEENASRRLRATYEYYLHGPLKRIELGENLQGIDFVYNIHGWLTQINHPDPAQDPGADGNDVFGMTLDYYQSEMNNLYSVVSGVPDVRKRHGLPEIVQVSVSNRQPFMRFGPQLNFSEQSNIGDKKNGAETPKYMQVLERFK